MHGYVPEQRCSWVYTWEKEPCWDSARWPQRTSNRGQFTLVFPRVRSRTEFIMTTFKSKTDRELSITANEFIWDGSGETEANKYLASPIINLLRSFNAKSVLDLGCGNGALSGYIGASGFNVVGCDFSKSGIDFAKKKFPDIHFFQQDLSTELPREHVGRYDAVISVEVIEHLLLPRKLLTNAFAALRPGGLFVLTTPYHGYWKNLAIALTNKFDQHWHPLRDFGHVKFFSKKTITLLFREFGFKNIRFQAVGRIPVLACSMIISGTKPA